MANSAQFLIRFGADAKSVTSAIRGINSSFRTTTGYANAAQKAFHFTGDSSALVSSISKVKSEINQVESASAQMKAKLQEGLDNGSIQKNSQQYNSLKNNIDKVDTKAMNLRTTLSKSEEMAPPKTDTFSAKITNLKNKVISNSKEIGTHIAIAGGTITALGLGALKSFGTFQSSLNQAAVTAGGTSKDVNGLANVANKMGAQLPLSAQDSAEAMIEMAQAGDNLDQIKSQFPAIAKASTATGGNLQDTAGAVKSAMNIWAGSMKSPQRAAAILTDTANLSNANIETMNQALSNSGPAANAMGMSMQDTAVSLGLITNTGMSARQAAQDLNHGLLQIQAPSNAAAKQMGQLGLSYTDSSGKIKPFLKIMEEVNDKTKHMANGKRTEVLKNLFQTAGLNAIRPILDSLNTKTKRTSDNWHNMFNKMSKDTKTTGKSTKFLNKQAKEMQKNVGSSIEQVGGNWDDLKNKSMMGAKGVHSHFLHMINYAENWATYSKNSIAKGVRGFIGMSPEIGAVTTVLGGTFRDLHYISGGLGSITGAAGNTIKTVGALAKGFTGISKAKDALTELSKSSKIAKFALGGLNAITKIGAGIQWAFNAAMDANPITLIIIAIAAVVAALAIFFTKTKTGRKLMKDFVAWIQGGWKSLVKIFGSVTKSVGKFFKNFPKIMGQAGNKIVKFFSNIWKGVINGIKSFIKSSVKFFTSLPSRIWNAIKRMTKFFAKILVGWVSLEFKIFGKIVGFAASLPFRIWKAIKRMPAFFSKVFTSAYHSVTKWLGKAVKFATSLPGKIWRGIKSIASFFGRVFSSAYHSVTSWLGKAIRFATSLPGKIWSAIKSVPAFFSRIFTSAYHKAINPISKAPGAIVKFFKGLPGKIWSALKNVTSIGVNIVKGIWKGITSAWSWLTNNIKKFGKSFTDGFKSTFQIGSPSKLMRDEIGKYIAQGIGVGVTQNASSAIDPVNAIKDSMIKNANGIRITPSVSGLSNNRSTYNPNNANNQVQAGNVYININGGDLSKVRATVNRELRRNKLIR